MEAQGTDKNLVQKHITDFLGGKKEVTEVIRGGAY
jgi:hypothetical protein